LQLAHRFLCMAARGARNERLPHDRSFQSSQEIAFVGDHLPRKCVVRRSRLTCFPPSAGAHPQSQCFSSVVNDIQGGYEYPEVVRFEIEEQVVTSYLRAADFSTSATWTSSASHEFGIFGGRPAAISRPSCTNSECPLSLPCIPFCVSRKPTNGA
jgi:hypothetical protein